MGLLAYLYVEENTEEANKAIELMDISGLQFGVISLKKEEADERREYCDEIPMLMSWLGIFKGLDMVGWYSECYGKGGPQHRSYLQRERLLLATAL